MIRCHRCDTSIQLQLRHFITLSVDDSSVLDWSRSASSYLDRNPKPSSHWYCFLWRPRISPMRITTYWRYMRFTRSFLTMYRIVAVMDHTVLFVRGSVCCFELMLSSMKLDRPNHIILRGTSRIPQVVFQAFRISLLGWVLYTCF